MPRKRKNRAPEQPWSRSEARSDLSLAQICLVFARNAGKNLSILGRQKRFLSWKGNHILIELPQESALSV